MFKIEQINLLLESNIEELTEAQLELLVENRLEFIKNSNKDNIPREHDPESSKLSTDKVVDHIATNIDTSKNKSHTQWLVNRYKAGDFKLSDSKNVKKVVDSFAASKNHLELKDIGEYKSLTHLKDSIAPVKAKVKAVSDKNKETTTDMPVVFQENGATGYKVPNKKTSIANYGPHGKLAQTRWCTAANSDNNMFDGYKGGKYTLHLDNDHILQLHHQTNQLKDVDNQEINLKKDSRFAQHKDTIDNFAKVTHELEGKPDSKLVKQEAPDQNTIDAAIKQHDDALSDFERNRAQGGYSTTSEVSRRHNDITNLLANASLSDDQFDKLEKFKTIPNSWSNDIGIVNMTEHHASSPNIKPEHISRIAKYEVSDELIKNPNNTVDSNHAIVDNIKTEHSANMFAKKSVGALPEHFAKIEHLSPDFKKSAIMNCNTDTNIPKHYFDDLKNSEDETLLTISRHPAIPEHIAEHINNTSGSARVLRGLTENHSVPFHIAKSAFVKAGGNLRNIIEHPQANKESITELVNHHLDNPTSATGSNWLHSSRLSKDNIKQIINHPSAMINMSRYGPSLTDAVNVKSSDLETLINKNEFDPKSNDHVGAITKSRVVNTKVLDTLLNKTGMTNRLSKSILDDIPPEHISSKHLHDILDSDEVSIGDKHKTLFHQSAQLSHFNKVKDDVRFHGAISNSENAPPSILHSLATSAMDHVRLNVAKNPNTEKRTYNILKNDANTEIAKISEKKAK